MKVLNIGENKTLHFHYSKHFLVSNTILVTGIKISLYIWKWFCRASPCNFFKHLPKLRVRLKPLNSVRTFHKMCCDSMFNHNPLLKNFVLLQPAFIYSKETKMFTRDFIQHRLIKSHKNAHPIHTTAEAWNRVKSWNFHPEHLNMFLTHNNTAHI
jgi:hypothetical protein